MQVVFQSRETGFFIKADSVWQIPEGNGFRINKVFLDAVKGQAGGIFDAGQGNGGFAGLINFNVFQFKAVAVVQRGGKSFNPADKLGIAVHFHNRDFPQEQAVVFLMKVARLDDQNRVFVDCFSGPEAFIGK